MLKTNTIQRKFS